MKAFFVDITFLFLLFPYLMYFCVVDWLFAKLPKCL